MNKALNQLEEVLDYSSDKSNQIHSRLDRLQSCAQKQVYQMRNILEYLQMSAISLNPVFESRSIFEELDGVKQLFQN